MKVHSAAFLIVALVFSYPFVHDRALAIASDGSGAGIVGRQFDGSDMPRGPSTLLNATTAAEQRRPSVAVYPEGDFVVVWDADGTDDADGIFGRRFDADGMPLGSELQISTYTSGNQRRPQIAIDSSGDLVVVWDSTAQDGSGRGVFGQRLARDGDSIGTEFQINRGTVGEQTFAHVAAVGDGFVVVWESDVAGTNGESILGQRFDASAQAIGTEIQASSYAENGGRRPRIAAAPDDSFFVVWDSGGQDGSGRGVFGRRYTSLGATIGGEIQINSYTSGAQRTASIASDDTGQFFIVWVGANQDGSGTGIFGQRYSSAGIRTGTEFQINGVTTGDQDNPDVAVDGADFVVAWQSFGEDGDSYGIQARRYVDGTGAAIFAVNEVGSGTQNLPAIAGSGDGTVIVWQTQTACPGDCDNDRAVTVDELVRGVNLALDRNVPFCAAVDPDGDRRVTVNELVQAVNATLGGCPV